MGVYFKLLNPYNATMHYIEVLVADSSYHGTEALTYQSETSLSRGALVRVPLKKSIVLGVVTAVNVKKPRFATRSVTHLPALEPLPPQTIDLMLWMYAFYPSPLGAVVQQFFPKDLPKKEIEPLHFANIEASLPPLTQDQQQAVASMQPTGIHLLHGDTGTGKTRVYMELAKQVLASGKSAIVLTPEIGLTSQLATNFEQYFGSRVIVMHSQLTEATRKKIWLTILQQTEPVIVIGPRSALFAPLHNIGLIVVDESHDSAYKQDKSPYYNTAHVAGKLAALHKAPLVLGSATPSVADYYIAEQKDRPIMRMTTTAASNTDNKDNVADITVVDLRDHAKFTKKSHLSDILIAAVEKELSEGGQVLLFLNRRGTARVVMCENCGWQADCPHCDLPLVYHSDSHSMRCHSCNYNTKPPMSCPICNNASIVFKSIGTKAIAEEAARLFPEASIQRFDTDNTKSERIENHYADIRAGKVDIIIGTQTLAKGLDLPQLALVGVIIADTSLYVPDFSSQERTFQLLNQVIGRVGRGHRDGKAIIQTYNPDSAVLKAVLQKDWDTFYSRELQEREQFMFPPFCYMLKIWCRRATAKSAQSTAEKCARTIRELGLRVTVEGPTPSFHEKVAGKYEWQLIIKSKNRGNLLSVVAALPAGWSHDIDPINLL